jgi:hypothetical protein
MPLVDPNASFDVAARHLFRHLTDPKQLGRNPLVRRFFEGGATTPSTRADERAALALIRELVMRGTEQYRSPEIAASVGRDAAYRRYTIVTLHCLEGRPLESVADQLGISMRQCYRERVEAMHRIAEYVGSYRDRPTADMVSILSEFRLRMDRAACRAEIGDLDRAVRRSLARTWRLSALRGEPHTGSGFAPRSAVIERCRRCGHVGAGPLGPFKAMLGDGKV